MILDSLCETADGREFNVEVQKANDDDHVRRVRYNTSCITANITDPGVKFEKVPDVIGIYISKFDMFKKEDEGGQQEMCELVENYAKKKEKDAALRFFQNGASYELVRASITSLTDEELQEIYQNTMRS